jgi:hypothetical protein
MGRIFAKPSRKMLDKLYKNKKVWQGGNLFILPHKPDRIIPEKSVVNDDPPEHVKPIYDKHGNLIGVLYDPPKMSGLEL